MYIYLMIEVTHVYANSIAIPICVKKLCKKEKDICKRCAGSDHSMENVIVKNLNASTARVTTQQEARTVRNIRLNRNS